VLCLFEDLIFLERQHKGPRKKGRARLPRHQFNSHRCRILQVSPARSREQLRQHPLLPQAGARGPPGLSSLL